MAGQLEPRNTNLIGKAQTVLGPIPADRLGVTSTHEHLLVDLSGLQPPPVEASRRATFYAPVTMELLGSINFGGHRSLDNSRLLDVETAIAETLLYKRAGGDTIVEATSIGIGRDPEGLRQIARATGLNVIMGASHYVGAAHPPDMDARSEDAIADAIVRDILEGVGHTGVRAGVIGEVGCSWPLTPNERKVLRASGRAQRRTGAPLLIHPGRNEGAPAEIVGVLRDVDADLSRTIIGHIERTLLRALGHEEARGDGMRPRVRPVRARAFVLQALARHRHDQRRRAPEAARLAHRGGPRADSSSWRTIRPRSRTSSGTAGAAMLTSCRTSCPGCARAGSRKRTSRRCWWRRRDGS